MQQGAESREFLEVVSAESTEAPVAECCQAQSYDAVVVAVGSAPYEVGRFGSVNETDRAVMTQHQHFSDVTDGRAPPILVSTDREHQLMLSGGQTSREGLFLTPVQETAETDAELEQAFVVTVGNV